MTDLKAWMEALDHADVPELWDRIDSLTDSSPTPRPVKRRIARPLVLVAATLIASALALLPLMIAFQPFEGRTPTQQVPGADWKSFQDQEGGWSLQYPGDWSLESGFPVEGSVVAANSAQVPGGWFSEPDLEHMPRDLVMIQFTGPVQEGADVGGQPDTALPLQLGEGVLTVADFDRHHMAVIHDGRVYFLQAWVGPEATQADRSAVAAIASTLSFARASTDRSVSVDGLSITLPPGWQGADAPLMPNLGDPREVLSAGTFDLPTNRGAACAQYPVTAVEEMRPTDALVTLGERRMFGDGFGTRPGATESTRPGRFRLPHGSSNDEWPMCLSERMDFFHWVTSFEENGRMIYLYVAMGAQASDETKGEVEALLNSIVVGESNAAPALWTNPNSSKELGMGLRLPVTPGLWIDWVGDPDLGYTQDLMTLSSIGRRDVLCPDIPEGEVALTLSEYVPLPGEPPPSLAEYPIRPARFSLGTPAPRQVRPGCEQPRDVFLTFRQDGRFFYTHVMFGPGAYPQWKPVVEATLSTLQIAGREEPAAEAIAAPNPCSLMDQVTAEDVLSIRIGEVRQVEPDEWHEAPEPWPAGSVACRYESEGRLGEVIASIGLMDREEFVSTIADDPINDRPVAVGGIAGWSGCGGIYAWRDGVYVQINVQYADCDIKEQLAVLTRIALDRARSVVPPG